MKKASNSLDPLGEKHSAGRTNLNVVTTTKEPDAWQSWESNDRTSCEYFYSDKATPVAQSEAISERLRNPRRNNYLLQGFFGPWVIRPFNFGLKSSIAKLISIFDFHDFLS